MKKIAIISIAFALLVSALATIHYAYAHAPLKGEVISLNDFVMGGSGKVTKDQAKALADAGNALVFRSGNKIYFVYNEDGSFAGKRLAGFATADTVGIVGKTRTVHGLNIIVISMIDVM